MPSSRGTKRKERNVLRRERPDVRRRISKEPDSFPSINPTSSSCIGYTVARLLRTLTPLGIIDIGKSAWLETKSWMLARLRGVTTDCRAYTPARMRVTPTPLQSKELPLHQRTTVPSSL